MQALRILTNFGRFRTKTWKWRKIAWNKLYIFLVLNIPQIFYRSHFFQNNELSEKLAKGKSLILTSFLNTLIFKLK